MLTKVVVLAGKVRTCVEVYVLGAIVRVSVEVNGIVIRSVYVWTLARVVQRSFAQWRGDGWKPFADLPGWTSVCTIVLAGRVVHDVIVVPVSNKRPNEDR